MITSGVNNKGSPIAVSRCLRVLNYVKVETLQRCSSYVTNIESTGVVCVCVCVVGVAGLLKAWYFMSSGGEQEKQEDQKDQYACTGSVHILDWG